MSDYSIRSAESTGRSPHPGVVGARSRQRITKSGGVRENFLEKVTPGLRLEGCGGRGHPVTW